jgi:hypothetical protein
VWFFDPHTGVSSPTVQPEIDQINKEKSNKQQTQNNHDNLQIVFLKVDRRLFIQFLKTS